MNDANLREIWFCSHCGHEVKESDEFCVACESVFAGTELAARSRFGNRVNDGRQMNNLEFNPVIEYTFA